MGRMKARR